MSGTLGVRHLVWIAVAATAGLVLGYVAITSLDGGPNPNETPAAVTSTTKVVPTSLTPTGPVVPDVVGERLPAAEEKLKAAGYRHIDEMDTTNEGRLIVEKDNWVVDKQNPPGGSGSPEETVIVLWVKKVTDGITPTSDGFGIMPNVVCAGLHAAYEALHDSGYVLINTKDGRDEGRIPLIESNWVVISQSEKPGSRPSVATIVTLVAVKYGEPAGDSGCQT